MGEDRASGWIASLRGADAVLVRLHSAFAFRESPHKLVAFLLIWSWLAWFLMTSGQSAVTHLFFLLAAGCVVQYAAVYLQKRAPHPLSDEDERVFRAICDRVASWDSAIRSATSSALTMRAEQPRFFYTRVAIGVGALFLLLKFVSTLTLAMISVPLLVIQFSGLGLAGFIEVIFSMLPRSESQGSRRSSHEHAD
eukprot:m.237317 g.237317  ORF g.237317 m.237317 type:complete len:195 (+) comp10905_c2_seq3:3511-4095(+)